MIITISPTYRKIFSADLKKHRDLHPVSDATYARDILRVSLNTFKRCIQDGDDSLSLKRQTFLNIFENASLAPNDYGVSVTLPAHASQYGGYDKRSYSYICGRFSLYRRSFLTAGNLNRSVLEIYPNPSKECLSFSEVHSYMSDGGVHDEHRYNGDIYIDKDRTMLSFPAYRDGQVRLTLIQMPQHPIGREKIKMRGALLTFGIPRGYWQPTVSCVFAEGPVAAQSSIRDLCGTIYEGGDEYRRVSAELTHTEEHAVVLTPMLWHRLHNLETTKLR